MDLLPQSFQQRIRELQEQIRSCQSGWSYKMTLLVCEKKDLDNLHKSIIYLNTIKEPMLHEKLSKEEYDARENALLMMLSEMMATFPFGLNYDANAMTIKLKGWKKTVGDMPYWALKKACEKHMKEEKEPSAGSLRKCAWSYVSKYSTMAWIISEQIKAIDNEKP